MTNEQYYELIKPYEDAVQLMLTKLEILNHSIYGRSTEEKKPVHHMQYRIKEKKSIEGKLERLGVTDSVMNAKDHLMDIGGIRVICYFQTEIYELLESLKRQNDLIVIKEKDYMKQPKKSGYRSYHIIFGVPLHTLDAMEYYPVEVQFRTLSMDFWSSLEHRICYKKDRENKEELSGQLRALSESLALIEEELKAYVEE
ncbi:MAG: (p)ppGpp synthetase [Lachnospiraceae bacterium]|nr:(p)ppGpp synthetase [Lachnospiraceae bacterium]